MTRYISQGEAIKTILDKSKEGRAIVPLIGAGISVDSGIPLLSGISSYLAKFQAYTLYKVYSSVFSDTDQPLRDPATEGTALEESSDRQETRTEQERLYDGDAMNYLRDFGWPDPNDLEAELWHWLKKRRPDGDQVDSYSWMDRLVQKQILNNIWLLDKNLEAAIRSAGLTEREWTPGSGYWMGMLSHLTRSNPDYIDQLFERLVRLRRPSTAHRYLAFLTAPLRMRTYLTTNYDTLLEDALRVEGYRPIVYDVADGSPLPHPSLIEQELAVLKIHGGAFSVRVGTRVDMPLDAESRRRISEYLPSKPVLLVLGVGGWEHRVLDILEIVGEKEGSVVWLGYGQSLSEAVRGRLPSLKLPPGKHSYTQVRNAGAFLKELHGSRMSVHPASLRPYRAYELRPISESAAGEGGQEEFAHGTHLIRLFTERQTDGHEPGASKRLAEFVDRKTGTHVPVWIDLESKSTVEDVIVDIISQVRRFDRSVPPEILAMEKTSGHEPKYGKAIRRIFGALSRGRYVVAFDGVGSFGRRPTEHHGSGREEDASQFFFHFCDQAEEGTRSGEFPLKDSILAFSVDCLRTPNQGRKAPAPEFWKRLKGRREWLLIPGNDLKKGPVAASVDPVKYLEGYRYAWLLLASFRRRRSRVALEQLLPKYLSLTGKPPHEDGVPSVKDFIQEGKDSLFRVEGGFFWMSRRLRDAVYDEFRKAAGVDNGESDPEESGAKEALIELTALGAVHNDLSRYYRNLHLSSREIGALLEFLYHRIASLKYLTSLEKRLHGSAGNSLAENEREFLHALFTPPADLRLYPEAGMGDDGEGVVREGRIDTVKVAGLRLRAVYSLCGTLEHEREFLLSRVPGPTLEYWLSWVRDKDLAELEASGEELPEHVELGEKIGRRLLELRRLLDDLEVESCSLRIDTVKELKGRLLRGARRESGAVQRLEDLFSSIKSKGDITEDPNVAGLVAAVGTLEGLDAEALRGIGSAFRRSGVRDLDEKGSRGIGDRLEKLHKGAVERMVRDEAGALRHLHAADYSLLGISPWEMKGKELGGYKKALDASSACISSATQALRLLEWVREESRYNRSYLHSLRGRAYGLLRRPSEGRRVNGSSNIESHYSEAEREFELSRAVLVGAHGGVGEARREARAISLLRHAEMLLFHSDSLILDFCYEWDGEKLEKRLTEYAEKGTKEGLTTEAGKRKLIRVDRVSFEDLRLLYSQCLSNWPREWLREIECGKEAGRCTASYLERARADLENARELLRLAEQVLQVSRRNVEWWTCYFYLQAQRQVERLLLMITGDGPVGNWIDAESESKGVKDESKEGREERRSQIHRSVRALRFGVQAVRRGLDVWLPEEGARGEWLKEDRILRRFLRLWVELFLCGAWQMRSLALPGSWDKVESGRLWEGWSDLNKLEGLIKLPRVEGVRDFLSDVETGSPELLPQGVVSKSPRLVGLEARGAALGLIDRCLSRPGIWEELIATLWDKT